jgi:hypothetical protein
VSRQHRYTVQIHVELVGGDLRQCGDVALAQFHLADRQARCDRN